MASSSLPPEAIAFATKMYDAARAGQIDIFEQALPAGLPAGMTNEKGDSLVSFFSANGADVGFRRGLMLVGGIGHVGGVSWTCGVGEAVVGAWGGCEFVE
jgi:hypothetical protein